MGDGVCSYLGGGAFSRMCSAMGDAISSVFASEDDCSQPKTGHFDVVSNTGALAEHAQLNLDREGHAQGAASLVVMFKNLVSTFEGKEALYGSLVIGMPEQAKAGLKLPLLPPSPSEGQMPPSDTRQPVDVSAKDMKVALAHGEIIQRFRNAFNMPESMLGPQELLICEDEIKATWPLVLQVALAKTLFPGDLRKGLDKLDDLASTHAGQLRIMQTLYGGSMNEVPLTDSPEGATLLAGAVPDPMRDWPRLTPNQLSFLAVNGELYGIAAKDECSRTAVQLQGAKAGNGLASRCVPASEVLANPQAALRDVKIQTPDTPAEPLAHKGRMSLVTVQWTRTGGGP